ncbi:MAG: calcium/sodium antiporter [Planctomycetes bacterium]|nr:calcium/sodium antiporter [Planctomycetota bacterium]
MDLAPQLLGFIEVNNLGISIFCIAAGILGLYYGAEFLVKGSSRLARAFGVKPLVIGLTLVAFGTSTPELMVSIVSAFGKTSSNGLEASLGNVVGSNIANIALILGTTALIMPFSVKKRTMRVEFPFMIAFTIVFWVLAFIGHGLNIVDGIILLSCFVVFILYCIFTGKSDELDIPKDKNFIANSIFTFLGLIFLGAGGTTLVEGGYYIMHVEMEISPEIIGLTLFAFGTSLPELVTSVVAQLRGHTEISVGNVLGSNIFNLALVMGIMALLVGILQPEIETPKPVDDDVKISKSDDGLKKLSKLDSHKETPSKELPAKESASEKTKQTDVEVQKITQIPANHNTLIWNFSVMMFFSLLIVALLFFRRKKIQTEKIQSNGLKTKDFTVMLTKEGKEYIRPLRLGRLSGLILLVLYISYIVCLFTFKGWAPWNYDADKQPIHQQYSIDK